jgi:hypothetical protein
MLDRQHASRLGKQAYDSASKYLCWKQLSIMQKAEWGRLVPFASVRSKKDHLVNDMKVKSSRGATKLRVPVLNGPVLA